MSKGKKTDTLTIYKIMLSMFSTNNFNETSRILNVPVKTVETVYKKNIKKEEFAKLCIEKKEEFIDKATIIIDKAMKLVDRRISTALDKESELSNILDEIEFADDKDIKRITKDRLIGIIKTMQLQKLSDITTVVGTLYDKRALQKGDSTVNNSISIKMDKDIEELAK